MLARATAMRASGECETAVIRFQERTAAELMEFIVYLSSTEGDDGHQGCQSVRLRSCKTGKGGQWVRGLTGEAQEGFELTVGARQGRDADTQGLTRSAVKRGQPSPK